MDEDVHTIAGREAGATVSSTVGRQRRWATTAFSILVFTESMLLSGFFLKKKPSSMLPYGRSTGETL